MLNTMYACAHMEFYARSIVYRIKGRKIAPPGVLASG